MATGSRRPFISRFERAALGSIAGSILPIRTAVPRIPAVALATLLSAASPGADFDLDRASRAVCGVLVDGHLSCSAFFIAESGACLTCAHALAGAGNIELLLAGGRRLQAARGGSNEAFDAAVLLPTLEPEEKVAHLALAEEAPRRGEAIYLAGSALYRHGLLLAGTCAGGGVAFEYVHELGTYAEVFYVSAMTPSGTSGGPWLNGRGEVVGLQSGAVGRGDHLWGVAFAVPARGLRPLAQEPSQRFAVGDLGAALEELWEHPPATVRRFSKVAGEGLLLAKVLSEGACDRAGLSAGQLIVSVEGRPCRFRADLLGVVRGKRPGDQVHVEAVREEAGSVARTKATVRLGSSAEALRLQGKRPSDG